MYVEIIEVLYSLVYLDLFYEQDYHLERKVEEHHAGIDILRDVSLSK